MPSSVTNRVSNSRPSSFHARRLVKGSPKKVEVGSSHHSQMPISSRPKDRIISMWMPTKVSQPAIALLRRDNSLLRRDHALPPKPSSTVSGSTRLRRMLRRRQVRSPISRGRHRLRQLLFRQTEKPGRSSNTCRDISCSSGASNTGFKSQIRNPANAGCRQNTSISRP